MSLKYDNSSLGYRGILVLNLLLGAFRIYFAYLGTTETIKEFLTVAVSPTTMTIINGMFLLLGVGGLIASIGMFLEGKLEQERDNPRKPGEHTIRRMGVHHTVHRGAGSRSARHNTLCDIQEYEAVKALIA